MSVDSEARPTTVDELRRRNWLAIALATIVMTFSYFAYAAAFVGTDDDADRVQPGLIGFGLAIAPFVFVVLAFLSRNPRAPMRVLGAMGLLLGVGLSVGLLAPILGATAGFAAGGAVALNAPRIEGVVAWRFGAVVLTTVYTLVLLVVATPAGVFSGGLLPLVMLGFADEYAIWRDSR